MCSRSGSVCSANGGPSTTDSGYARLGVCRTNQVQRNTNQIKKLCQRLECMQTVLGFLEHKPTSNPAHQRGSPSVLPGRSSLLPRRAQHSLPASPALPPGEALRSLPQTSMRAGLGCVTSPSGTPMRSRYIYHPISAPIPYSVKTHCNPDATFLEELGATSRQHKGLYWLYRTPPPLENAHVVHFVMQR